MITSYFNGKPYLDLIVQGKQLVIDKIVYIVKHKSITSTLTPQYAATVNIYGMPAHGESKTDKVLIDSVLFNLPSVADEYCETIIRSKRLSLDYSAIIIEITDSYSMLEDIGTETVVLTTPSNIIPNDKNTSTGVE